MTYLSYNVDVLKVGAEQVALGGKTDPKAAVAAMLKKHKELAEVFEDQENIKELEVKTAKLFKENFKPVPKPKAEKVAPKKPTKAELAAKAAEKINKKAGKKASKPKAKTVADKVDADEGEKLPSPEDIPTM